MKHYATLIAVLCFVLGAGPAIGDEPAEFEGLIEPCELVNIGTPVKGVVEKVNVTRSDVVEKGQLLINLDSSVERGVVARARVFAAEEGEIKLQREKLAFAKRMFSRIEELFKSEAISAEKRDQAATEVKLARSSLQKAIENRSIARLDLERAQVMLDRRTIKSPISGIVVEKFVSPGEFVDSQPLLKIAKMDPLRVEVILTAEMFQDIQPGMKADIIPDINKAEKYSATVSIVDRIIDSASGTFGVRLELPNPDYRLPGGLKCTVRFHTDEEPESVAAVTETTPAIF